MVGCARPGAWPAQLTAIDRLDYDAVVHPFDSVEHRRYQHGLAMLFGSPAQLFADFRGHLVRVIEPYARPPAPGSEPFFGWAKIIRPATVWSTRVTTMSRLLFMCLRPFSTTIMVPSSK